MATTTAYLPKGGGQPRSLHEQVVGLFLVFLIDFVFDVFISDFYFLISIPLGKSISVFGMLRPLLTVE